MFDSTSVVWGFVQIGTGVLIVKANIGKHDSRIREYIEINVPEDINKYLVKGEKVDKEFDLENGTVFTSKNKMFIKKDYTVKDISYVQISRIEFQERIRWLTIIIGILLIVLGYNTQITFREIIATFPNGPEQRLIDQGYGWLVWSMAYSGIIIGFSCLLLGFLRKIHRINLKVSGISRGYVFNGNREILESLLRLVSERKVQAIDAISDEKITNNL